MDARAIDNDRVLAMLQPLKSTVAIDSESLVSLFLAFTLLIDFKRRSIAVFMVDSGLAIRHILLQDSRETLNADPAVKPAAAIKESENFEVRESRCQRDAHQRMPLVNLLNS